MATRRRWALPLLASLLVLLVVGALVSLPIKAGAASQVMEPPADTYAAAVAPACAPADTYPEIALDSIKGTVKDLASDGETIWVLQETSTDIDTLSAYNLSTGARDTDQDINPQGVSNLEPQGVWIDETTLYMPDDGVGTSPYPVRAFKRSDGNLDTGKGFTLSASAPGEGTGPRTIWSDGETMWVADLAILTTLPAYSLVEDPDTTETEYGAYLSARNLTTPSNHNFIAGHGTTLWSAHKDGGLVAAYDLTDYSRDESKDLQLPAGVTVGGLWADGERLWVAQRDGSKISVVHQRINASGLAVAGTPLPGERLSANRSGLTDPNGIADDVRYSYQWLRDCQAIPGATRDSYRMTDADLASALTLRVSFTDEAGNEEEVFADPSTRADQVIDVPWHWDLVPEDLWRSGGDFRLIFLTDAGFAPDSTDIEDYNRFVEEQARAPDTPEALRTYHRWFRVLGSTADVDARDNTASTGLGIGVPTYWLQGDRVADRYSDFYNSQWFVETSPTNRRGTTLSINALTGRDVITGSESDGRKKDGNALGDEMVAMGRLDGVNGVPLPVGAADLTVANTDTSKSYYALSPLFRVSEGRTLPPPEPCQSPPALLCATLTSVLAAHEGYTSPELYPHDPGGSMTDDTFSYGGIEYTILALTSNYRPFEDYYQVFMIVTPQLPDLAGSELRLDISGTTLEDFLVTQLTGGLNTQLLKSNLSAHALPDGNQFSVAIHDRTVATGPPLVSYDSVLNSGNLPAGSQFRVMFAGLYVGHDATYVDDGRELKICDTDPDQPECAIDEENTNIHDYNLLVQQMARWGGASAAVHYSGIPISGERRAPFFRALISTAGTDARDNTATTYTYSDDDDDTNDDLGVPIYWLTGKKVADDYRDFYDGTWDNPNDAINMRGASVNRRAWPHATGSRSDGTVDPTGFLGHPSGQVRTGSGDNPLGGGELTDVDSPFYIYALSPIFEVRPPKPDVAFKNIAVKSDEVTLKIDAYEHEDRSALTRLELNFHRLPMGGTGDSQHRVDAAKRRFAERKRRVRHWLIGPQRVHLTLRMRPHLDARPTPRSGTWCSWKGCGPPGGRRSSESTSAAGPSEPTNPRRPNLSSPRRRPAGAGADRGRGRGGHHAELAGTGGQRRLGHGLLPRRALDGRRDGL